MPETATKNIADVETERFEEYWQKNNPKLLLALAGSGILEPVKGMCLATWLARATAGEPD